MELRLGETGDRRNLNLGKKIYLAPSSSIFMKMIEVTTGEKGAG